MEEYPGIDNCKATIVKIEDRIDALNSSESNNEIIDMLEEKLKQHKKLLVTFKRIG